MELESIFKLCPKVFEFFKNMPKLELHGLNFYRIGFKLQINTQIMSKLGLLTRCSINREELANTCQNNCINHTFVFIMCYT
jgi:hypothetical protein